MSRRLCQLESELSLNIYKLLTRCDRAEVSALIVKVYFAAQENCQNIAFVILLGFGVESFSIYVLSCHFFTTRFGVLYASSVRPSFGLML